MKYKESIIAKLREQWQPIWENYLARQKAWGAPQVTLEEHLEVIFNQRVNCGGYALEIDACIFPAYNCSFDEIISGLIERFPFIRLLGDTELLEDEYLVAYRANDIGGHHFVKIFDGNATEKNDCHEIRKFNGWSRSLQNSPQAVFAVKKSHDIEIKDKEGEQKLSLMLDDIKGKDFEATVEQAILNVQMNFSYHQHEYNFVKNNEEAGRAFICSSGRVIAEVVVDDGECVVDINEQEREYVSNTTPINEDCVKILEAHEDIEI